MRIEHIALYVQDLEGAKDFFVKYFDACPNDKYHNPKTGFSSYFLTFEDGTRLEIMHLPEIQESENAHARMGYIHIASSVGSRQKVDTLTNRFRDDGYRILSGPRTTGDGYYESCILGFEGNQIEITE